MTKTIALWITAVGGVILGLLWLFARDSVPMGIIAVVFGAIVAACWMIV